MVSGWVKTELGTVESVRVTRSGLVILVCGAGDQKCSLRERQVQVSRVRGVQKLSYAEAVKKVEEDGSSGRYPERSGVSSRSVPVQMDRPTSDILDFWHLYQWLSTVLQGWNVYRRK